MRDASVCPVEDHVSSVVDRDVRGVEISVDERGRDRRTLEFETELFEHRHRVEKTGGIPIGDVAEFASSQRLDLAEKHGGPAISEAAAKQLSSHDDAVSLHGCQRCKSPFPMLQFHLPDVFIAEV